MGKIRTMVDYAVGIARDDSHGYSWADRWDVDRDCSSLMHESANVAGYDIGRGPSATRYTGTMIDGFCAAGFTQYAYGSVTLQRGDILLRDPWGAGGHTEMYIGDGMTVGAHSAEDGGVYGQPGDQTGNEISVAPLWGSWDYVLRPQDGGSIMGEWIEKDGKWWYRHADGSWTADNWEYINGQWYFFDSDGWMKTGWVFWNGYWFYMLPKSSKTGTKYGHMITGWQRIKYKKVTSWFCFDGNGAMYQSCFAIINGKWYGFDKDGRMIDDPTDLKFSKDGDISFA